MAGRHKSVPSTEMGKLIHEYLGPKPYRWLAEMIERVHGIQRSEEAIRYACLGRMGKNDHVHRGLRPVNDEPATVWLIVDVLGIPEELVKRALAMDWVDPTWEMAANGRRSGARIRYCGFQAA